MSLTSSLAIFFITWWVCLFIVLPWGVRNPHESGKHVEEGHEAGAPVNPMLLRKVLITTVLASAIFAAIYFNMANGWISLDDIPLLRGPNPLR